MGHGTRVPPRLPTIFFLLRLGVIQSTTTICYSNTVRHLRTTVIETSSFSRISQKAIVFVTRRVCVLCYFICASRLISMFLCSSSHQLLATPLKNHEFAEGSHAEVANIGVCRAFQRLPRFD